MKVVLHKIGSIALAFLLLASTTSWAVGKHYCMGRVMDVSFFAHADDCGMDMDMPSGDDSEMEASDSCCSDKIVHIQGQDDLKASSFAEIGLDQLHFLLAVTHFQTFLSSETKEQPVPHDQYPPPILVKDIHLLDQVFLI